MHRLLIPIVVPLFLISTTLTGCGQALHPTPLLPDGLKVGVTGAVQPMGTSDLLAGFIPEQREAASPEALHTFNEGMSRLLREQSRTPRSYVFVPAPEGVDPSADRSDGRVTVLRYWVNFAKEMGFDMLIVPQILNWHERQGSAAGAVSSAEVNVNFYLIDARGEGELVNRSHFNEKQAGLADNLLSAGTFFRRGGKWLTAEQLAEEGMLKMIQEFGL